MSFTTGTKFENKNFYKYDLRTDPREFINETMNNQTNQSEKQINVGLTNNNDEWTKIPYIPDAQSKNELISQYGVNLANQIIEYSFENSVDPSKPVIPPHLNSQNHLNNYNRVSTNVNVNKFSPAYAGIIGSKPRATTSANIRLGGVYRK
jgi:hypothetical protein